MFVSWTQFGSCSGNGVPSPIKVAAFPLGASSVPPSQILNVPGSTYSQGSSIAADGAGGFWIAWEEYPSAVAATREIRLARWSQGAWSVPQVISPAGFSDLPSPLPGFAFRTASFPALAVTASGPNVAWTSYDSGVGRTYLWSRGTVSMISNSGGDQFFPAIATKASAGVHVSFSQVNSGTASYDQYLWDGNAVTKVSTASSYPNSDAFFSGKFIGDYNSMAVSGANAHPIWTDIRGANPNYSGYQMDSMVYSP